MKKNSLKLLPKALFVFFLCQGFKANANEFIQNYETPYEDYETAHQLDNIQGDSISAPDFNQPCRRFCLPCDLTLFGEIIFFKPSIDQSSYVISSIDNIFEGEFYPNGRRHLNPTNYRPALRLGFSTDLCNGFDSFDFTFTYFNANYSQSKQGFFLFDTIGWPGNGAQAPEDINYSGIAKTKDRFRYYTLEAVLSRHCITSCADNLYFFMGLQYANIEHKRKSTSFGDYPTSGDRRLVDNLLLVESNFWGIGPELGFNYQYVLPCSRSLEKHLSLFFNARASLLCSSSTAELSYNTQRTLNTEGIHVKNDHLWRVTPAFDARLGGSYEFSCFCMPSLLEIGYEWAWYNNCIDYITGYDVAFAGDSLDTFSNLSLHGPFIRLTVEY
ncbi:Lpg1974 family pore-forming outer membrane protein [Criblamydia sequanensis]|uniref:Secreted protein n=1 Tax=Candidatus Criblamydia sequanensis CRIB-18 TaxID=1437425 RepID=A0A090D0U6_9BACT|nr:Lpg1974 family pore-forming outer membrane protein [Criblamydia sequanensis]CDR35172.1 putative secreted protein [Criblamydia sequanensis CRIB-18]